MCLTLILPAKEPKWEGVTDGGSTDAFLGEGLWGRCQFWLQSQKAVLLGLVYRQRLLAGMKAMAGRDKARSQGVGFASSGRGCGSQSLLKGRRRFSFLIAFAGCALAISFGPARGVQRHKAGGGFDVQCVSSQPRLCGRSVCLEALVEGCRGSSRFRSSLAMPPRSSAVRTAVTFSA